MVRVAAAGLVIVEVDMVVEVVEVVEVVVTNSVIGEVEGVVAVAASLHSKVKRPHFPRLVFTVACLNINEVLLYQSYAYCGSRV
jgi:hypothetical protein